jgi:chromosome partitioning protein
MEEIYVFHSFSRVDSAIEWSQDSSAPVVEFKKGSRSAKEYKELAEEVISRASR